MENNILTKLFEFFFKKEKKVIEYTPSKKIITSKEISKLFPHIEYPYKMILDGKYNSLSMKNVLKLIPYDLSNPPVYEDNFNDCDDFAIILWAKIKKQFQGAAVALAISGIHAFIVFVDENHDIWFIEAQTSVVMNSSYVKGRKYEVRHLIF